MIDCRLCGAKPFPGPMLAYYQLGSYEQFPRHLSQYAQTFIQFYDNVWSKQGLPNSPTASVTDIDTGRPFVPESPWKVLRTKAVITQIHLSCYFTEHEGELLRRKYLPFTKSNKLPHGNPTLYGPKCSEGTRSNANPANI